jgi:muconolactone delta-isomerase
MLMLLHARLRKPESMSNREFYGVWRKEAETALAAKQAGVIQAIWKAAGSPEVFAVLDVESGDAMDAAIQGLPIWSLGYSHLVTELEWTPLRPYEHWAEDLKTLAGS